MLKQIIAYLALLICSLPLFAQIYSGVNTLALSSEGAEAKTQLTSEQLVARLTFEKSELSLMVKTGSIWQLANEADKRLLMEEFMIESNPLLSIKVDISSLGLNAARAMKRENAQLPYKLMYNGQTLDGIANVNLDYDTAQSLITFDISLESSMYDMGIRLADDSKRRLSDALTLSIESGTLTRRY